MARPQLHRLAALVADIDGIGPQIPSLIGGRFVLQELRCDADADPARNSFVHGALASATRAWHLPDSRGRERAVNVRDQVADSLEPYRQPQRTLGDPEFRPRFRFQALVRCGRWMRDDALGIPQ